MRCQLQLAFVLQAEYLQPLVFPLQLGFWHQTLWHQNGVELGRSHSLFQKLVPLHGHRVNDSLQNEVYPSVG